MPQKTKKEKLRTEIRRRTVPSDGINQNIASELVKGQIVHSPSTINPVQKAEYTYEKFVAPTTKSHTITGNYTYVVFDLIKITIFTIFALGIQIVLYFLVQAR